MKKFLAIFLVGAVCVTGCFAKTAVVFFSCTGNSKQLAQAAAKAVKGDLFEIVPEQSYTSADLNWHDSNSRSSKECNDANARPAMKNKIDLAGYDTVVVVHPIWWGLAPKIVYTFVESTDFSGKKVVNICTSGSSSIGNSGSDLARLAPKASWRTGSRFSANVSVAELKKFLEEKVR